MSIGHSYQWYQTDIGRYRAIIRSNDKHIEELGDNLTIEALDRLVRTYYPKIKCLNDQKGFE